jgi:microcin C transport system substrate-binding protein
MLALMGAIPATLSGRSTLVFAQALKTTHGLSAFGDLKYSADFRHFDYVNPDAPVGGVFSHVPGELIYNQNFNTFNSMNSFILRGDAPLQMEITFASLMARAFDEPDAVYGQAAKLVRHNEARTYFEFHLREDAVFHDGAPLTAEDVVFSIEILKKDGHPLIAGTLAHVQEIKALSKDVVSVSLAANAPRDVIFTVAAEAPIFSRTYYSKVNFNDVTMSPPLGSGPFKVGRFEQGRFIEYERVKDWWGWSTPAMRGQFNWNRIRVDFYHDLDVAFEAFKAGEYFLREEFSSRLWAIGYDFPAVKSGQVKTATLPDGRPSGMQGFFFNLRKNKFLDPRIRRAIGLVFDFEWSNNNLFYKQYVRTQSVFQNSPLMAQGAPLPEELALLSPYRDRLPEEVFEEAIVQPVSDGSGSDRKLLHKAAELLGLASVTLVKGEAFLPSGEKFTLEFLNDNPGFERIFLPYIKNLHAIGIDARVRTVDPAQYRSRTNSYDFDIVSQRYALSATPGDGLRRLFSSKDADVPGTYNLAGLKHPVVDALIEKIIAADNRSALQTACRALDRVLRALNFWVPQWYKPVHAVAYWDIYRGPQIGPAFSRGITETWWLDEAQAKKLGKGL